MEGGKGGGLEVRIGRLEEIERSRATRNTPSKNTRSYRKAEDRERQEIRRNPQKHPIKYPYQKPQAKTLAPTLINFDDDVLLFYGDWEGVSDVGSLFAFGVGCVDVLAAFDLDFVFSDAALCRVPPRLSGFDVEFPAVPGASEDLAFAGVVIGAWRWRL